MFIFAMSMTEARAFAPMQVFTFPGIPFDVGVRHIHSPEHFVIGHGLAAPGFEIIKTNSPLLVREYVLVEFRYKTWLGQGEGRLFTDNWNESMLWLWDRDNDYGLTSSLRVWREGEQGCGMEIKNSAYGTLPFWEKLTRSHHSENQDVDSVLCAVNAGYGTINEDSNLRHYRRLVMWGLKAGIWT